MMDRYEIDGGRILNGTVSASGSKNGTLPLMAAALLTEGTVRISNVPNLQDIHFMAMVLRIIGADVHLKDGVLTIDSSHCNFWEAPYELVRKMRASFYVLGPLLARFKQAKVSLPGGCNLGPRPVDLHLKAFKRMGCKIDIEGGYVLADGSGLHGARIDLDIASVGATGNIMMAATAAKGATEINNAACEPEIIGLAEMLRKMGAQIEGAGTSTIKIEGDKQLQAADWTIDGDRIETATLLLAGAITNGQVTVTGTVPAYLNLFLNKLEEAGINVQTSEDSISVDAVNCQVCGTDITASVYPGFPTDLQAPWTSLMSIAEGDSMITDSIYPERFSHVPELARLGAHIRKDLRGAYVKGVDQLTGASVMCSDIRAAAALVLAAIAAKGHSSVLRIYHLDRGYDKLEDKLNSLGASIQRVRE